VKYNTGVEKKETTYTRNGCKKVSVSFFAMATSQSPGLPEILAAAYNPGMCLLELPVITDTRERVWND